MGAKLLWAFGFAALRVALGVAVYTSVFVLLSAASFSWLLATIAAVAIWLVLDTAAMLIRR